MSAKTLFIGAAAVFLCGFLQKDGSSFAAASLVLMWIGVAQLNRR